MVSAFTNGRLGDWNADLSDPNDKAAEVLKLVAKQMGLQIVETGPTRGNNTLDFALVGLSNQGWRYL